MTSVDRGPATPRNTPHESSKPCARRGGRRPREAAPTPTARAVRQAREATGLTMRATAARAGFGVDRLSDIEHGRRLPTPDDWGELAKFLRLGQPPEPLTPRPPVDHETATIVMTVCRLLVLNGTMTWAAVRRRAGIRPGVEDETLRGVQHRLASVGVTAIRTSRHLRLVSLADPGTTVGVTETLSTADAVLLTAVAEVGPTDRRSLARLTGRDCTWSLKKLARAGLVTAVGNLELVGAPNTYAVSKGGRKFLKSLGHGGSPTTADPIT
jgi:transcriptional regulator with XRE-family HTH domain